MLNNLKRNIATFLICSLFVSTAMAQTHPRLILTVEGVAAIRSQLGTVPLFDKVLEETKAEVDAEIANGLEVPVPKDMAGGYTHERHKKNFFILQKAGNLFQITGDEKYAVYTRDMLLEYAELFPTLGLHPTDRSYATGKIFWQCLNDANWLVYVSQAYDCIYDWLKPKEVKLLNKQLFRPFADFISIENPQFFNRIHNHSTWANAAVGMIGLVMDDEELVERALYGIKNDGISSDQRDNDGGYIKVDGVRKAGFLAQLDYSFSPDGHFTEGPYYLRYAMTPFLMFGNSLANNRPDIDIMNYRDGIFKKSIHALLNQTDAQGRFFPINDAQKGMSWLSREVIAAVNIGYASMGQDPQLLDIAKKQNTVSLDMTGFAVARDIEAGKLRPFMHQSKIYTDGNEGRRGGLALMRTTGKDDQELCLLFKYAAQGMGHGHFDRLGISIYDEVGEGVQDYGSARWVNIDQKGGGRYLPENKTFAKQSIAHNTAVINQTSHYGGKVAPAEKNSASLCFSDLSKPTVQVVSAMEEHAYENTVMHRTLFLINDEPSNSPFIVDVFRVKAKEKCSIDFPFWYTGHILSHNADMKSLNTLSPMGSGHGYQHIYKTAEGKSNEDCLKATWFTNGKFYSKISTVSANDEVITGLLGANDPNFNLRHDPVLIHRKNGVAAATFASAIECHGTYSPVGEIPLHPFPDLVDIRTLVDTDDYTILKIGTKEKLSYTLCISNSDFSDEGKHRVKSDIEYEWNGPYHLIKNEE